MIFCFGFGQPLATVNFNAGGVRTGLVNFYKDWLSDYLKKFQINLQLFCIFIRLTSGSKFGLQLQQILFLCCLQLPLGIWCLMKQLCSKSEHKFPSGSLV